MRSLAVFAAAAVLLAACDSAEETTAAPVAAVPSVPDHWTPVEETGDGAVTLFPEPEEPVAPGRHARRLSVDQLRRSIPALFGGITWTMEVQRNGRGAATTVAMFEALARTLGEADYIDRTENNLEASPLFAKFMDDMAGMVCRAAVERDLQAGPDEERLVIVHPGDPDANLRFLRLKLHSLYVPEGSTEGLEELRALFDGIVEDVADENAGWYGVCVAMLTAPELMAY